MALDKICLTRKIVDELKEEIGLPTIVIIPNKLKKISLTSSKFGGLPYWDKSIPYPTDTAGNKLKLLAQFNLSEVAKVCPACMNFLPKCGILQFFLLSGDDYLLGSDLEDYTNDEHFRVIYHPTLNENIILDDVLTLNIPIASVSENDFEPIKGEIALDFEMRKSVAVESEDFKIAFIKKASSYGWNLRNTGDTIFDTLHCCLEEDDDEAASEFLDYADNEYNCLLGCPEFVQFDPRTGDTQYAKYDTQLFQMVSYDEEVGTDFMAIWGDMGIAHFFINYEKLLTKDFSDIMYYWDCS